MRRALAASGVVLLAAGLPSAQNSTEPTRTPVVQNDTVAITQLRFGPAAREAVHTHPFPLVLIQITPGTIAVEEQNTIRRGGRTGEVWYITPERTHAVTRQAGATGSVEMIAVALLPNRPSAPAAPPTEAPPNISRLTLVDNTDVRVVRVRFAPGGAEPVHTHPNDLVTVQITDGKLVVINGHDTATVTREPGFVQFLPRNVQHSYASADANPFELISISIK